MAFFNKLPFWFLVTSHVIPIDATVRLRPQMRLSEADNEGVAFTSYQFHDNTVHLKSNNRPRFKELEPGDIAAAFKVITLDGDFSYMPGSLHGSLIIHAFTHKSGFLESLWNTDSSLSLLVRELPESAQVLFLSFDDSAVSDALWMRDQVHRVAVRKEVLARLHFSPVPVFTLGNWIPTVLYSWCCARRNCGLSQAVFTSKGWKMPVIVKRLDARYDWLEGRWGQGSFQLVDAGDGCESLSLVPGAVAWVSEGNCSYFTKVQSMVKSNASGVLVYAQPGNPLQDMNCVQEECSIVLDLPAAMVHLEISVAQALRFEFYEGLRIKLQAPAVTLTIFDKVVMQGDKGAVATVDLPPGMLYVEMLELDMSLFCPGRRDATCPHWDHTVQLHVCCDGLSPYCNMELGRWITPFRRGIGRWLTDVTPLIPLLGSRRCTFTMTTAPWAMPWVVSLNLRLSSSNQTGNIREQLYPFWVMPLYSGGTFDKDYNKRNQPIKVSVPASTRKVLLYAVITGHGSDENGCGEFCVTSHHFLINGLFNNSLIFDTAGTDLGCTVLVQEGAVPNEDGTWLYGRGGWCDGLQVSPWITDITLQLDMTGQPNMLMYLGLFEGRDPDPAREPGYIIMSSFLVFYN